MLHWNGKQWFGKWLICALAALLVVGCGKGDADPQAGAGADAEAVTLQTLDFDGIQQLIASHRGKVVVLDAWATSCPPCIEEFPKLVELHRSQPAENLACISLSFDEPEDHDAALQFLRAQNATFDNVVSAEGPDELYARMDLASVPAVYVYDRQGRLHTRFDSEWRKRKGRPFTYEDVRQLVSTLNAG